MIEAFVIDDKIAFSRYTKPACGENVDDCSTLCHGKIEIRIGFVVGVCNLSNLRLFSFVPLNYSCCYTLHFSLTDTAH